MEPEEGKFNWITFHGFLENFLRRKYRSGQKLAMIIDNAGYHKKRELWPFYAENRQRLRMLWLPPYSPELNPIERVWRLTRRQVTHNKYFESIGSLRDSLERFFWFMRTPNIVLRSLCAIT